MDRLLHERPHGLDRARREERRQRSPQCLVIGTVDFADAKGRLPNGARNAHFALVADAVVGVGVVFVGERIAISGDLADLVVARNEPETAVVLVPRDRTATTQIGVDRELVLVELIRMVVEIDHDVRL